MLFLEFHGIAGRRRRAVRTLRRDRRGLRRRPVRHGRPSAEERTRLWQARHDAVLGRTSRLRPGAQMVATDVCVPISRLAECVTETQRDIAASRAGGADRRPCRRRQFPPDAAGRHDRRRRGRRAPKALSERLVERALAMDGTCTGEHGVGQGKMKYLARARRGGARRHGGDQARARPAQHHESGQDRGRLTAPGARPAGDGFRRHRIAAKPEAN